MALSLACVGMIKERSFQRSACGLERVPAKVLVCLYAVGQSTRFFHLAQTGDALSEQADEPIVIDAVALAGIRFKAVAVDNRKLAVVIANQAGALKLSSDISNPSAPYA